ncbi:hypothetical protein DPMN_008155 [Dreissena polymorpha]|uniref:Uncharacterized protein n=1 Tax=Dreissena polymorpha TaxID=45954 RepID=A0A9D4MUL5_DREPO|nr:hypothetical protein DPMN_008155 [Dreissena polymorpha]
MKHVEKEIVSESGPIGRDNLPVFKFWKKTGTVVERVVRTTSDTFGPAGDHTGVRDRWEAFCAKNSVKSIIGNYKDNRFNCLFQNMPRS